jgi:arsenate reductase-like glutaredoxin family protein
VIANRIKFHRDEALALARQGRYVWASKGRRMLRLDLEDADDDALARAILGRSGTLRAPAFRVGEVFLVGFHQDTYEELFGAAS